MCTRALPAPSRRGIAAPFVAISLVVLLSFVALAVDGGFIYSVTAQMQRTADASALAGVSGVLDGGNVVRSRAKDIAIRNEVAGNPVVSSELGIVIGNWEGVGQAFTPTPDEGVDSVRPNAVQITGTRTGMNLFFAPVMGHNVTNIRRSAIALVGSGRCAGIWGLEGVNADGSIVTDSYDSDAGRYGPGNIRPNGDVCSCQDIVVNGNVAIMGDAMYGEGNAFIPFGSAYEVFGIVDDYPCGTPTFTADYAAAAATNDNGSIGLTYRGRDPFGGSPYNMTITGNDHLTLPAGTFYFDSVLINGQGYIEVTGPTVMFINGPATFTGGGLVNTTGDAENLIVYAAGPTVNMSGNSTFYGAIVAPTALVTFEGTSNIFGVVLGRLLDFDGDTTIHVDEAMVFDLFGINPIAPILIR